LTHSLRWPGLAEKTTYTLPETNIIAPEKFPKGSRILFQPSIFRCENVGFREGNFWSNFNNSINSCEIKKKVRIDYLFYILSLMFLSKFTP